METDCGNLSFQGISCQGRFRVRQIFCRDKEQISFSGPAGNQALAALP